MFSLTRRFTVTAFLAVLGLALASSAADAQVRTIRVYNPVRPVNPNWLVAPGLTLNQWYYNQAIAARALSNYPPWAFGYNPYPQIINYGPVYRPPLYTPYYDPSLLYLGLYNPYAYANLYNNPYSPYSAFGYSYFYR